MYMANLWQAQHLNVANNVIANIVNLSKKLKRVVLPHLPNDLE